MLVDVFGLFLFLVWFYFILIKGTSAHRIFYLDIQTMFPFGEVGMRNSCSSSVSHEVQ